MSDETNDGGTTGAERLIGGRYRVTGTLGRGGMATVYRAVDELLEREVAVKVFRIGPVDHGERSRAEAEIRVLANLRDPAVVTLYDAAIDDGDGESYMVMELVPGTDLATRLREGPLAPSTAAVVGAQVAEGLAAAHAQGIVHRDVKPANVLLENPESNAPRAKLADFGIALLRDATRLTGTGTVMGTAAYLAPEQVTAQHIDGKADVYSLGLVLLEALTGRQAFPGSAVESATARLARQPEIDTSLPVGWRTLLHTMTMTDPADRPTAAEVTERLRALGRGADEGPAPTRRLPGGAIGAAAAGAAAADAASGASAASRPDDATAVLGSRAVPRGDDAPTTIIGGSTAAGGAPAGRPAGAAEPSETGPARPAGSGVGGRGGARPGSETERARRARTRAWIIAAVALAVAIIVVLVVLAIGSRGDVAPAPTDTTSPQQSEQPTTVPSEEPSTEPSEQQPSTEPSAPSQPSQEPSTEPSEQQPSSGTTTSPEPAPATPSSDG